MPVPLLAVAGLGLLAGAGIGAAAGPKEIPLWQRMLAGGAIGATAGAGIGSAAGAGAVGGGAAAGGASGLGAGVAGTSGVTGMTAAGAPVILEGSALAAAGPTAATLAGGAAGAAEYGAIPTAAAPGSSTLGGGLGMAENAVMGLGKAAAAHPGKMGMLALGGGKLMNDKAQAKAMKKEGKKDAKTAWSGKTPGFAKGKGKNATAFSSGVARYLEEQEKNRFATRFNPSLSSPGRI